MTKCLPLIASALLAMSAATASAAYDFTEGGLHYKITSGTEVAVAEGNSSDTPYTGDITVPQTVIHDGTTYTVTSLGSSAFDGTTVTSVTLPQSLVKIDDYAFYDCKQLTALEIPQSVATIDRKAFSNCSALTSINIPAAVRTLAFDMFSKCNALTRVDITDLSAWCTMTFGNTDANPLNLAHHLYLNGEELTDVVLPPDIEKVNAFVFQGATAVTSVTVPGNIGTIDNNNFCSCPLLTRIVFSEPTIEGTQGNLLLSGDYDYPHISPFYNCPVEDMEILRGVQYVSNPFQTLPQLQRLVIGDKCRTYSCAVKAQNSPLLRTVICEMLTLPDSRNFISFAQQTYDEGTLYLNAEVRDTFLATDPWQKFVNVQNITAVGIEDIDTDSSDAPAEYYNMQGARVERPESGICIERRGNTVRKIIVRN